MLFSRFELRTNVITHRRLLGAASVDVVDTSGVPLLSLNTNSEGRTLERDSRTIHTHGTFE